MSRLAAFECVLDFDISLGSYLAENLFSSLGTDLQQLAGETLRRKTSISGRRTLQSEVTNSVKKASGGSDRLPVCVQVAVASVSPSRKHGAISMSAGNAEALLRCASAILSLETAKLGKGFHHASRGRRDG